MAGEAAVRTGSELRLLGGFRLTVDGCTRRVPPSGQRLLALLALRGPHPRSCAAGTLWGDVSESRALARLRTAVWRLGESGVLVCDPSSGLIRRPPGLCVDADDVGGVLAAHLPADHDLLGLELLPGWYDDWVLMERELIRFELLRVLERAADQALLRGEAAAALEGALLAVRLDPLRESAHRLVIRAHLADGNLAEAGRRYQMAVDLLRAELGAAPSWQLLALRPAEGPPASRDGGGTDGIRPDHAGDAAEAVAGRAHARR
jgi:DNA-binding SARP family transcriptional activator